MRIIAGEARGRIIEAPAGKEKLEDITAIMATNSSWNRGLPLAAAGYVTPYYKKD